MTVIGVTLVTSAAAYLVALWWALRDAPEVQAEILGDPGHQELNVVTDGMDWSRLPHEIRRAVEAADGPGVLVEQLTPGLALAVDEDTDEAIVLEQGHGELVRFPMYRLRDVDPVLLVKAIDDPTAAEAATRGDLLVDAPPNDVYVKVWVRGDEGRHFGVHRCCCVPGWPWGEE